MKVVMPLSLELTSHPVAMSVMRNATTIVRKKAREPVAHVHAITSGHVISGYVTSGQGRFR
jgi:hypothetical protein